MSEAVYSYRTTKNVEVANILSNEELIGSAYVQAMMVYRVNNVDGITAIFTR